MVTHGIDNHILRILFIRLGLKIRFHPLRKFLIYQNLTRHDSHPCCTGQTALMRLRRSRPICKEGCMVDSLGRDGEEAVESRNGIGDVPCSPVRISVGVR